MRDVINNLLKPRRRLSEETTYQSFVPDRQERERQFARERSGEACLSCARRTNEQYGMSRFEGVRT